MKTKLKLLALLLAICNLQPETAHAGPNYALAFNGTSAYLDTSSAVIPTSGDFTVEVWFNCPLAPNTYKEMLSQGSSGNAFYMGTDLNNNLRLGDTWGSPGVAFPMGGWHHLAVVKSSTNTILYLDGTNRLSKGSAIANPAASTGLRFGRQYSTLGEYWAGSLDDVRVWNVARSAEQIKTNRFATLVGTETGLVANWQFNEGRGTTITSLGSSQITSTLLNGPRWMLSGVWLPNLQLNGANPLTNVLSLPFTDPGATVTTPVVAAGAGNFHCLALKVDGTVAAWGYNGQGQTSVPADATNVVAIAGGDRHNLALKANGTVIAWGNNTYGQASVPVSAINVVAVAAGENNSLVLKADGTLVSWGDISYGDLNPSTVTTAVAIAAGDKHGLALKANGTVVAWGANSYGQATVPASTWYVVVVAAGYNHSLALKSDGTVVGWGLNDSGQTTIPASATNVVAIAAGGNHSLALKADGTVVAWGDNFYGQLNDLASLTEVVAIAAGGNHSLVVRADGSVIVRGNSAYGELNLPSFAQTRLATGGTVNPNVAGTYLLTYGYTNNVGAEVSASRTVVVVSAPPSIVTQPVNIVAFAGNAAQLSVLTAGTLPMGYQWYLQNQGAIAGATNATLGWSSLTLSNAGIYYVLATNAYGTVSSSNAMVTVLSPPVIVAQPTNVTALTGVAVELNVLATGLMPMSYQWFWQDHGAVTGATNTTLAWSSLAMSNAGVYYAVIGNADGTNISGNATVTPLPRPVIVTQPATFAALAGTAAALGVSATGTAPISYQWYRQNQEAIAGATNATLAWSSLAATNTGTYYVVVTDANSAVTSSNATVRVLFPPMIVSQPTNCIGFVGKAAQVKVSAASTLPISYQWYWQNHIAVADATNATLAWGSLALSNAGFYWVEVSNADGMVSSRQAFVGPLDWQLNGANPLTNVIHTAFTDPGATLTVPVMAVAAGYYFSMALTADGTVKVWGKNDYSQTTVPAAATNVVAIAAGSGHCLALKADGTMIAWGDNSSGQANVPASATNVVAIAGGGTHSLAVKADGSVVAWGGNSYGQADVPASATDVVAIAAGSVHSLALKADGSVIAWGWNYFYATSVPDSATHVVGIAAGDFHSLALKADGTVVAWGMGSQNQTQVPASAINVVAIAAGGYHSLALKADGTVVAWGANTYGQASAPASATNVVRLSGAGYHSLALNADGKITAWGRNNYGQTDVPSLTQTFSATSGTVATNVANTYLLTYSYTNRWGTVQTTNRTVVVSEAVLTPPILANLAVVGSNVGFTVGGNSGQTVVVETCTNLAAPVWVPVQTNTLGGSPMNFSAPVEPQSSGRFYRLRSP